MRTRKSHILMPIVWMLVLLVGISASIVTVQSANVSTVSLVHNATYTAPSTMTVTMNANGGTFDGGGSTYNTTVTFGTLTGTRDVIPSTEPTRSGYLFDGWEYSTNGSTYQDVNPATNIPFAEHLYIRAKWEESYFEVSYGQITGVAVGKTLPANVVIPSSITGIMNNAFENNSTMTSITIPSSVVGIGWNAFKGSAVTSVTFEEGSNWWTSQINADARSMTVTNASTNATNLKTTYTDAYWTKHSTAPTRLTRTASASSPYDSYLTLGEAGSAYQHVIDGGPGGDDGYSAYCYNGSVVNAIIPYGVTGFRRNAFQVVRSGYDNPNTSLTSVFIPGSIREIDDFTFEWNESLVSVTISHGVTSIGEWAFSGNHALTSITLPKSITNIENYAFRSSKFEAITVLATTPPTLGDDVFDKASAYYTVDLIHIYVPSESVNAYKSASGWSSYASIISAIP